MADDNLVLEHLRAIRGDLSDIKERLSRVETRLTAVEQQMGYLITLSATDRAAAQDLTRRVERIERRLELNDP